MLFRSVSQSRYAAIYQVNDTKIIGKTDADFLDPELAYANRNSDMEVVKALKELQVEETIRQDNKKHTYLALKFPLYDYTGRIYAIGSIATDINTCTNLSTLTGNILKVMYANGVFVAVGHRIYTSPRYRDWETDRKSTRLNSSHLKLSRMPSSA